LKGEDGGGGGEGAVGRNSLKGECVRSTKRTNGKVRYDGGKKETKEEVGGLGKGR